MSDDSPLATFEFRRGELAGSHLSLFSACLVHRSADRFETIHLDRVASLGAAFERDTSRIAWGGAMVSVAILLFIVFWPLRTLVASAAGEVAAQAQGGFLPAALRVIG